MKKCINKVTIEGYLYQHSLAVKTVQNQASENYGKEFINGTIDIATDEAGLNVVPVHFTYVTPTTKTGGVNKTYNILKSIIDGAPTWIANGKDEALKLKCEPSFALNDFVAQDGQMVSQMIQEGGFISTVSELGPEETRNTFTLDFLITNVTHVEADEEKNIAEDYCTVRGAGFNFRNALLPMTFKVVNPQGMNYFESLDATNTDPVFIKVWGRIINRTTRVEKVEESAFGDAAVTSYERKVKEWIITGVAKEAYDYGDENILVAEEVTKAMQDRQVLLAEVKRQNEEYKASKATAGFPAGTAATPAVTPKASSPKAPFNF